MLGQNETDSERGLGRRSERKTERGADDLDFDNFDEGSKRSDGVGWEA